MQFREANEKDLMALAENRWDFEAEYSKFDVSKNKFLTECSSFLKEGLLRDEWVYWIAEENDLELLFVWPSKKAVGFYERAGFKSQNEIMELIIKEDS